MKRSVPSPLNPDRLPSPVVPRPSPWAQLLHPTTRSSIPHQTPPSPASHLWSPARQARPPPEREARRRSLMVRAGDRSHHGGGPIGPRPGGSGSHSLRRCSLVSEQEPRRQRQQAGSASGGSWAPRNKWGWHWPCSPVPLSQGPPCPPPSARHLRPQAAPNGRNQGLLGRTLGTSLISSI